MGGKNLEGVKIKSTIHWININYCFNSQVNIYNTLFTCENPESEDDFLKYINKNSLKILKNCKVENHLRNCKPGDTFQFLRNGYFCLDKIDESSDTMIFNKTVSLKSSYKKA